MSVSCVLQSYADLLGAKEWKPISPDSDVTKQPPVSGVVLRIVEPTNLAGRVLTFHFDGPPSDQYRQFYEPGLLYKGEVPQSWIGKFSFMCDPGLTCTELVQPLPTGDLETLRRLLVDRHWNEQYIAAVKKQFGDKVLFGVLYGFLTQRPSSYSRGADQQRAARYLVKYQPASEVTLAVALRESLAAWDEDVSDWPLYLWRAFGRDKLASCVDGLEVSKLNAREREKVEMLQFWLTGDEEALAAVSRK